MADASPAPAPVAERPADPEREAARAALRTGTSLALWAARQGDRAALVTPGRPGGA